MVAYAGVALLVAWRLYSRLRRLIGRRQMSPGRAWSTIIAFPLLLALLLSSSIAHPLSTAALVLGSATGIALGLYGLRVTRFEVEAGGYFYTPSAHLGIALMVLLVCRLAYRFGQIYFLGTPGPPPSHFVPTPLTSGLVGVLAAYYVTYAIGLLRWRSQARVTSAPIG